ncbi:MAG: hypothetical protein KME11_12500 [Timaviella obliquedivisa GSE-PSE-MK23-08B]|jgi:hypothetical protein|nr:hypothetical protein [Timaviella obliquedivisa GSE-PSE-MK23-08B]
MSKTSNQTNGNGNQGFAAMAQMPQGYNLDHGDYLGFNAGSAKDEVEAMKQRIESLNAGLSIMPYAQKVAELEAEFYKKLADLRKAIIRREISKNKAEAELRVSLQALGIALDKIMGNEAQRKTDLVTRANDWKQKAELKSASRPAAMLQGSRSKQKA